MFKHWHLKPGGLSLINCQLFYDHQNIPSIEISVSQYSHHLNIVEQPPSPSTNTNVTNKKQRIPPWNPRLAKSSHTFYVLPQLEQDTLKHW